jgi:hypothetical protein
MKRVIAVSICVLALGATACGSKTTQLPPNNNNNNNMMNMPPAQVGNCDGFAINDGTANSALVQTYAYGDTLMAQGCGAALDMITDGTKIQQVSGIYELDTNDNGASSPSAAIFAGTCSDLGMGTAPSGNASITPPQGASTIAAAYGSATATSIYGVVTAISAWGTDTMNMPHSGTLYIQDASPADGSAPAPKSGVQVYFPKANAMTYGTAPSPGDVIAITGVKWSPYKGVNQFSASATTMVTKLGSGSLPTAVKLHLTDVGPSSNVVMSGYEGMRVTITGAPFTISGTKTSKTCPLAIQYVKPTMMNPMMMNSTYCDGLAVKDASGNPVYMQYYAFGGVLKAQGCMTTVEAYTDGATIQTLSGVYDLDTSDNGSSTPSAAIFPGSCSDMGIGTAPGGGQAFTPPMGASTIAAAYGNANASNIFGVVTAVYGWGVDMTGKAHSGTIYLQDPTANGAMPASKSGAQIYFSKKSAMTYGTVPSVGDVVQVTGVKWSPYKGVNQFSASMTTAVTKIGTSALPTPVLLNATDVGPSSNVAMQGYEGMRVSVMGGPFTVNGSKASNTCPAALEYTSSTSSSGGGG